MTTENIQGPVLTDKQGRVPLGTRVQIDIPLRTSLIVNGAMFSYSGYFLYHTLKGLYKLSKEVPS